MKYFIIIMAVIISSSIIAQDLTGDELLDKAISYHDPNNNWEQLDVRFNILSTMPNRGDRLRKVHLNNKKGIFSMSGSGAKEVFYYVSQDETKVTLDGLTFISTEDAKKYRANAESAALYRDYISYLYGLPMKLKDPGTIIHPKVEKTSFYDISSLRLKVTYEKDVGEDTWYFYFDPNNYSLKAYQFFHDESANDGEYIILEDEFVIDNIRMPAVRKWYVNKDHRHLGTDTLKPADE